LNLPGPDLSVVAVNYNSAGYVRDLVASLRADPFMVDGRPGSVEVIIVDNASRADDQRVLEGLRADDVCLLRNAENVGYALANNQGFHIARGRWHMVTNPDVDVVPGCLAALLEALESRPEAAVVGPLASMDPEGRVLMPPNELPDPYLESMSSLARRYSALARYNVRRRAQFAHSYWCATVPIRLPMLSGGCFLARRSTFAEHGLFDPGYPLYYEDTDLFRRFHQKGLELWHVPEARIVHHFSRSATPRMKAAMYRNAVSARRYFRRFFGGAGQRTWARISERANAGDPSRSPYPLTILGPVPDPPTLDLGSRAGTYLEVAGNPQFTLAVGIFPESPGSFDIPRSFWDQLGPGEYWARASHPSDHETLNAWKVIKCPKT
jgi:GT2 family glycosyltransferase